MHEFTAAQNILSSVLRVAAQNNAKKISEIALELSAISHLNRDQLVFSLNILSENTIANGAKIRITKKDVKTTCKKCSHQQYFKLDDQDHFKMLVSMKCSKCGNKEAFWILRQMRGSDEPESRFYTCTKCKYRWRED